MTAATVVLVPGLRRSRADHWQMRLAATLPDARCVPPLGWTEPGLQARVTLLDRIVDDVDGPVVLVAHSAGVVVARALGGPSTGERRSGGRCWRPRRPSPVRRAWTRAASRRRRQDAQDPGERGKGLVLEG